jgi:hypothetical protein
LICPEVAQIARPTAGAGKQARNATATSISARLFAGRQRRPARSGRLAWPMPGTARAAGVKLFRFAGGRFPNPAPTANLDSANGLRIIGQARPRSGRRAGAPATAGPIRQLLFEKHRRYPGSFCPARSDHRQLAKSGTPARRKIPKYPHVRTAEGVRKTRHDQSWREISQKKRSPGQKESERRKNPLACSVPCPAWFKPAPPASRLRY